MRKRLIYFILIFTVFFMVTAYAGQPINTTNESASLCGPIPALCYPTTLSGGLGIGIYFVSLNQISNTSSNPPMLEDFTCTDSTWLVPGVAYSFEMHTGNVYEESATVWIDFSNDGDFDPSEIVYRDSALIYLHQGLITVPTNALHTFTPIRMRTGSENPGNPLTGCNDAYYGQYEDYTIYYGAGIGINDGDKTGRFTLAPNPFHTTSRLNTNDLPMRIAGGITTCDALLQIYNSMGALVRFEEISNGPAFIINRGSLDNGLYFYELTSGHELLANGKLVIE